MLRQIKLLSGIQLVNLFGLNEVRYTKDKSKKARFAGMAVAWAIVLALIVFYVALSCFGYIMLGMEQMIPSYLFALTSLIMLLFTFFKAGSIIFQMKSYEMLVSLPVSEAAIVISRFLTMYVTNFLLGVLVVVPGMAVYGIFQHPGAAFYIFGVLGIILLPLIPLTIAAALGAGIMALTAKMRHKSVVSAVLIVVIVLAVMIGSMAMSGGRGVLDESMLENLAELLREQISRIYPPAIWFQNAVLEGSVSSFLMLLLVSAGLFVILTAVLQKCFLEVCSALNAVSAKNDYKMEKLSANSVVKALWKKEMKRYFASSVYVTNTVIGYVWMAILAIALFVMGPEKMEAALQIPGITGRFMPLALATVAIIMPAASCSISMEGKNWWRLQTLPVKSKDIWNGKILWNLILAFPFYVTAVVFSILTLKPSVPEVLCLVLVPACYIVFSAVLGITVNLLLPIFNWENEARVVKQSASTLVTMVVGFISVVPTFAVGIVLKNTSMTLIYVITMLLLLVVTAALYQKNAKATVQL